MRSRAPLVLAGVLAVIVLVACGDSEETATTGDETVGTETSGEDATSEALLVIHAPSAVENLDPHTSQTTFGRPVLRFAYDTLVAFDQSSAEVVPQLAESWEAGPDSATFFIRPDVTCSDGSPLTAETVARNFERLKDPAAEAPFTASFLGSTEYEVSFDKSANSVTLELPKPFNNLLNNLTHYPGIVCDNGLDDPAILKSQTAGSGPFVLEEVTFGDRLLFSARDDYTWGPDGATTQSSGFPSDLEIRIVENETTAANLLNAGDLDVASFISDEGDRLQGPDFSTVSVPTVVYTMQFNFLNEDNPLQDLAVRRALMQALDRSELSQIATGSSDQQSNTIALPQSICGPGAPVDAVVGFDLEAAEQGMISAGWSKEGDTWVKDGAPLQLRFIASGPAGQAGQVGGDYVFERLTDFGVQLDYQSVDEATGFDIRASGDWDFTLQGWTSVFDPMIIAPFYARPDSATSTYLANAEYERITELAQAAGPDEVCDVMNQAERAVHEQVSLMPMYYEATRFIGRDGTEFEPYRTYIAPTSLRTGGG